MLQIQPAYFRRNLCILPCGDLLSASVALKHSSSIYDLLLGAVWAQMVEQACAVSAASQQMDAGK